MFPVKVAASLDDVHALIDAGDEVQGSNTSHRCNQQLSCIGVRVHLLRHAEHLQRPSSEDKKSLSGKEPQ